MGGEHAAKGKSQGPGQLAQPAGEQVAGGAADRSAREADGTDNVIHLNQPAASTTEPPSPNERYLDRSVNLATLPIPFARFPGTKMVLPDREGECQGFDAFVEEIAPSPPSVIEHKHRLPYYMAVTLKDAE